MRDEEDGAGGRDGFSKLEWAALGCFLAAIAAALAFLPVRDALEAAADWVGSLGWWAPVGFVLVYVLCALALLPRTILTVASGLLFGVAWGLLWSLLAANLASSIAFLAARHFARGFISRHIHNHDRLDSLDRAVAREGWRIVALTRLTPVFPYSVLNYAYGLTRVRWRQFALGTFLGMLPGFTMLVALGDLTGQVADGESSPVRTFVLVVAAVGATLATVLITRFARRSLRRSGSV